MTDPKKPFLCRLGVHRWRFGSPIIAGCGAIEWCLRCGLSRTTFWAGATIYHDRLTPEAQVHLKRAFEVVEEAFVEADKAFEAAFPQGRRKQ